MNDTATKQTVAQAFEVWRERSAELAKLEEERDEAMEQLKALLPDHKVLVQFYSRGKFKYMILFKDSCGYPVAENIEEAK